MQMLHQQILCSHPLSLIILKSDRKKNDCILSEAMDLGSYKRYTAVMRPLVQH